MNQTESTARRVTLVGVDYSEHSRVALTTAAAIVRASPGAELHVLHVVGGPHSAWGTDGGELTTVLYPRGGGESGKWMTELREEARTLLPQFCADAGIGLGERLVGHVRFGRPDREIVLLAAELGAQLVVVGTHGRSGLGRVFLGSVAERVVRAAPCAVLVARPSEGEREALIEPPCPDCVRIRASSQGAQQWCARHSEHHPRAHTYGAQADSFGMGSLTFRF
jgi:nucleotide-binding universal stress UspA family protein